MTLSVTSSPSTPPERPAPDTAAIEVMNTVLRPKALWSGASAIAMPVVWQLGMAVTKPFQPRRSAISFTRGAWSEFTPGMRRGESASMRKVEAAETTGVTAAYLGSSILATSDSTAEKMRSTEPGSNLSLS